MRNSNCGYRPFLPSLIDEVLEGVSKNVDVTYKPAANISEDEKSFTIELALPGFTKEDMSIKFEKDMLTITASHEVKENESTTKYTWNEFAYKEKFSRSFQLPETIDNEAIAAKYENGILSVTLPKKEEKTMPTKQITIA